MTEPKYFRFGRYELFPELGELRKDERKLSAQNQELQVLEVLLERAGTRVAREELVQRIWPSTHVGKNNLNVVISQLRNLLSDSPRAPRFIQTVGRIAYCFIHPVETASDHNREAAADQLAQRLYWKARKQLELRTPQSVKESIRLFRRAISADPSYSLAYAGLSDAFIMASIHAILRPKDAFPRAQAAVRKALTIHPDLTEAVTAEAWVHLCFDWDFVSAEKGFRTAISLQPEYPFAHNGRTLLLLALNRATEAVSEMQAAWRSDAMSAPLNALLADAYYHNREFRKAIEQGKKAIEWDPQFPIAHACLGRAYLQIGRSGDAVSHFEKARDYSRGSSIMLGFLAHAYAKSGCQPAANAALQQLLDRRGEKYVPAYFIALVYFGLDDTKDGLNWLNEAVEERSHWVLFLNTDPAFDDLRSDARFCRVLERVFGPARS